MDDLQYYKCGKNKQYYRYLCFKPCYKWMTFNTTLHTYTQKSAEKMF